MHTVVLLLVVAFTVAAQPKTLGDTAPERNSKLWNISATSLAGASALDISSSWGKCCEANRLLASSDGRFAGRGAAIKSASVGTQLLVQYLFARRNPRLTKALSVVNFVGAGALTAVAIRNYGIPGRSGARGAAAR